MHTNMGNLLSKLKYVSYITEEQRKVFTNFVAVPNRYMQTTTVKATIQQIKLKAYFEG